MSCETIQSQLDKLYADFRIKDPENKQLVGCGLVDEAAYTSAPHRIVWILKEPVDDTRSEAWTLPGYFREVANNQRSVCRTSRPLGAFSAALLQTHDSYASASAAMSFGLRHIGVTNLKKSGGGTSSSWSEIDAEAARTVELWTKELEIMKPDIVICGGTYWHIHQRIGLTSQQATSGWYYGIQKQANHTTVFIQAHHPASWRLERDTALRRLQQTLHEART